MATGSPGLELTHVQAVQMSREEKGTLKEMSVTHICVCSSPKLTASFHGKASGCGSHGSVSHAHQACAFC